jgi:thiol:disulfide interchange protein DsbA
MMTHDTTKLAALLAAALLVSACSNEQAPAEVAEDTAAAVEETVEEATATVEEAVEAQTEEIQLVEESAAEPEPEEQAIVLAQADTKPQQQNFKYEEGTHYTRFVPAQPTMGGPDQVEVAEFFWFGCPHCFDLEPFMAQFEESKPAGVRIVRVPVSWNRAAALHAKMFYTAEALENTGALKDGDGFRTAAFEEFHQRGNRLLSESSMQTLFERFGVSEADFNSAWNSFDVDRKLRLAQDLATRYSIDSVPAIVVNGKYKTGAALAGSNAALFEVIDELIARETVR